MDSLKIFLCAILVPVFIYQSPCHAYSFDCGDNFQISGPNYCYMVSKVKMRWGRANQECYKYNAELVQIFDNFTMNSVLPLLNGTTGTRWWTGLNDRHFVGVWTWGVKSRATEVLYNIQWIKEPDEANHRQNCAAINFQGSMSDERCWDRHRYICEYTNTPGTPCSESWINYTTGCYLFPAGLRDPFSMLTWNSARQKCVNVSRDLTGLNVKTHLLQLETQDELDYIRQQLPLIGLTSEIWWIGLNDSSNEGQWKWLDGTPLKNPIWAQEPNNLGGKERCGYMNAAGQFGDLPCNNTERFICMKENDESNLPSLGNLGCPATWLRAGHYCYRPNYRKVAWSDASTACQQMGSNLIKVDDMDKKAWLQAQYGLFSSGRWFWTGLNRQGTTWMWADNTPANQSTIQWHKEPNNYMGQEACGVLLKAGTFNDESCLLQAGFICEQNSEDAPCPMGWLTIKEQDHSNCYYISNTTANFDEAHAQCTQLSFPTSSYLVAFNTKQELTFIISQIQAQTSGIPEWYTGLTDAGHEGFWAYDTSFNQPPASGFIPWSSMPEFIDGDENCVAVISGGNYINTKCTSKWGFICERPATGYSVNAGSRVFLRKFSVTSVFILAMYFVAYALCLHYILHITYVLFPAYA